VTLPPPLNVIPLLLGIRTEPLTPEPVVHDTVHGPGTATVSPLEAEVIAVCTLDAEQDAALMVAASTAFGKTPIPDNKKESVATRLKVMSA